MLKPPFSFRRMIWRTDKATNEPPTFIMISELLSTQDPKSLSDHVFAYLIDPLNNTGSWRMMESRDLSVCSGSLQMSIPSMTIFPADNQWKTNKHVYLPCRFGPLEASTGPGQVITYRFILAVLSLQGWKNTPIFVIFILNYHLKLALKILMCILWFINMFVLLNTMWYFWGGVIKSRMFCSVQSGEVFTGTLLWFFISLLYKEMQLTHFLIYC